MSMPGTVSAATNASGGGVVCSTAKRKVVTFVDTASAATNATGGDSFEGSKAKRIENTSALAKTTFATTASAATPSPSLAGCEPARTAPVITKNEHGVVIITSGYGNYTRLPPVQYALRIEELVFQVSDLRKERCKEIIASIIKEGKEAEGRLCHSETEADGIYRVTYKIPRNRATLSEELDMIISKRLEAVRNRVIPKELDMGCSFIPCEDLGPTDEWENRVSQKNDSFEAAMRRRAKAEEEELLSSAWKWAAHCD